MATLGAWLRGVRGGGKARPSKAETLPASHAPRGRDKSPEERRAAVESYARSGMNQRDFARAFGVSVSTLGKWLARYAESGPKGLETRPRGRPKGSNRRPKLPVPVREEIARTQQRFPDFGLKKVRDFLRRFRGVKVSTGAVRAELERRGIPRAAPPRPKRKKPLPQRFERSRPGELWQSDITSFLLTRHSTRVYLVAFVDDYSRFVVSHGLFTHQRGSIVSEALMEGVARFGKPKEVLTDQGRQYFTWRGKSDFQKLLAREGITHVVSRTHHPETLGKCERLWETINREFWERVHPQDLSDARERLAQWIAHYNFFRTHQGIDGLVPADRFFGAESALRKTLQARLTGHELDAALGDVPRKSVYLFGQVGDEQVSLSGERGELVMHTSSGVRTRIGLDELGAPESAQTEVIDGTLHECDGRERVGEHERDASAAHGQEAAEVCPAADLPARSQGAVDGGVPRGAGDGAPELHADPGHVAGEEASGGGLAGALDPAAARVAAQPAGAGGHAGRPPASAAAAPSQGGDDDGPEDEGSANAGEAQRGAGAAALRPGGPDPAPVRAAEAEERAAGVGAADAGGEIANAPQGSGS
jgi:transposase InsO family protein